MGSIKTKLAGMSKTERIELLVVIMLGVTAVLTAWATWVSGLHGSNQAQNYTTSNIYASEGNSEYNAGVQSMMQDMLLYNEINSLSIDLHFAERRGDSEAIDSLSWKIEELVNSNMTEEMYDAYEWAIDESEASGETVSPFENDEFVAGYFEYANELLAESEAMLQQGNEDNKNSDAFGLVAVIYAVALFLLGITATFRNPRFKTAVFAVSMVAFLLATIYMATLPMPTGFSFANFLGGA